MSTSLGGYILYTLGIIVLNVILFFNGSTFDLAKMRHSLSCKDKSNSSVKFTDEIKQLLLFISLYLVSFCILLFSFIGIHGISIMENFLISVFVIFLLSSLLSSLLFSLLFEYTLSAFTIVLFAICFAYSVLDRFAVSLKGGELIVPFLIEVAVVL